MVFVPCPNVAHIALVGQTDGQQTVNDLYFVSTAPPITALSLGALTSALAGWYAAEVAPNLSETWAFFYARGRDLTTQFSFVSSDANSGVPGGTASEQAPSNVAVNLTLGSGLAGRNNHGSNRIPGIPNSIVTINNVDIDWLGLILDAYSLLLAPSVTLPGGWTWVVLSRFSGSTIVDGKEVPTPRAEGVFHEIFDIYFTDDIVDSQKTRLPKHGK